MLEEVDRILEDSVAALDLHRRQVDRPQIVGRNRCVLVQQLDKSFLDLPQINHKLLIAQIPRLDDAIVVLQEVLCFDDKVVHQLPIGHVLRGLGTPSVHNRVL
uniref:(northern house mosquito) hypothetical protein n=1 Tax=Culex pipiens TaxID=7175 RepID=A0A8D8C565_CULPI